MKFAWKLYREKKMLPMPLGNVAGAFPGRKMGEIFKELKNREKRGKKEKDIERERKGGGTRKEGMRAKNEKKKR